MAVDALTSQRPRPFPRGETHAQTDDRARAPGVPRRTTHRGNQRRQRQRPAAPDRADLVRLRAWWKRHLLHWDARPEGPKDAAHREGGRAEPLGSTRGVPVQVRNRRGHRRRGRPTAVRRADARRRPPVPPRGGGPGVRRSGARAPQKRARTVHDSSGPLADLRLRRRGGVGAHTPGPTEQRREGMAGTEPVTELEPQFSSDDAAPTPWAEAREHLEEAEVYWLSTVRLDGRPHVTPLVAVWLDGVLYFCTGPHERKARNLGQNPHCVLTTG